MDNLLSQEQFDEAFNGMGYDRLGALETKVKATYAAALITIEQLESNLLTTQNSLRLVSMLASDTPQFHNPIDAVKAKMIRDTVLAIPAPPTDKEKTS